MALTTQPYKGTRDFYPEDQRIQNWMFGKMREVALRFGYEEYNGPMLEPFELYAAKSGEEIVNQQLYWLMDRGERKMAVRPEMTPTLARMVAGKLSELPKPVRWFSIPNLWRYERPQRGRLREHWQLNVDVLGGERSLADAEILCFALELLREYGGENFVQIKVNHRGLMDHVFQSLGMSAEMALKMTKLIDARGKMGEEKYHAGVAELGVNAKQSEAMDRFFKMSFSEVSKAYPCDGVTELSLLFERLKDSGAGKQVVFDPLILRGLDYYTGTVFEMYDISPENNRAMFGGGRYDNLIGLFGKDQLSGVGLGWGDVTLRNFLETHSLLPKFESRVDVMVTLPKMDFHSEAETVVRELRRAGLSVVTPLSEGGFGHQLKYAAKVGAHFAVLLGEEERVRGAVALKDLKTGKQEEVALKNLAKTVIERKKETS